VKQLIRIQSGAASSVTIPVPRGKWARIVTAQCLILTADVAGETVRWNYNQSGTSWSLPCRSSIGIASFFWSCAVGMAEGGGEILISTVVATGVAVYYSPATKTNALPDVVFDQDLVLSVTAQSTAVASNLIVTYELVDK
jgi:hypothetical protein